MSHLIHVTLYFENKLGNEYEVNVTALYYPAEEGTYWDEPTDAYFEITKLNIKGVEFSIDELADYFMTLTAKEIEEKILDKLSDTYYDFADYSDFDQYIKY
jgi:hypothetical protein